MSDGWGLSAGETRLALLLFSDLLAEGAGNSTSVSSDEDGGLHLTASLRWGKKKNTRSIVALLEPAHMLALFRSG